MTKLLHASLMAGAALAAIGPARAFADLNFDATTVAPDTGFETIPAGWYNVLIDESAIKPTKDGTGAYLELRFNVIDGQYANRKLYTRLNIKNANVQTVEIAYKQLSAICHAVGVLKPGKSEELHGIPLKGKVKIRPGSTDGQYEATNEFTSYKNINEAVDQAGGDAGAAAFGAGAPAASGGAPAQPWAAPATAALAGGAPETPPAQPWAAPGAEAAAVPPVVPPVTAPEVPAVPAAPVHDPIAAAVADGWIKHPSAAGYHYKGSEAKPDGEVAAMYPAPAAPVVPPTPAVPDVPAVPAPNAGSGEAAAAQAAPPPWAQPKT